MLRVTNDGMGDWGQGVPGASWTNAPGPNVMLWKLRDCNKWLCLYAGRRGAAACGLGVVATEGWQRFDQPWSRPNISLWPDEAISHV